MDWMQFAERFGLPVTFLAVLLYAIWRVGKWLGTVIVKPVVDEHVLFIRNLNGQMESQSETLSSIAAEQQTQNQMLNTQNTALQQMLKQSQDSYDALTKIGKEVFKNKE